MSLFFSLSLSAHFFFLSVCLSVRPFFPLFRAPYIKDQAKITLSKNKDSANLFIGEDQQVVGGDDGASERRSWGQKRLRGHLLQVEGGVDGASERPKEFLGPKEVKGTLATS